MSGPACAVCGQGGYWVGYDTSTDSDRCANHIGTTPESLRLAEQDYLGPRRVPCGCYLWDRDCPEYQESSEQEQGR